jgi:aspartate/methionine/tyrosine aminotransferase
VVSDEVYHPLYFGVPSRSASRLPGTIVLGSCSKVYALSGARVGWMIDRDAARRRCAWNARAALTISNAAPGEALAEVVVRHRDRVLARTRAAAERNLARLDAFFARHADRFGWVRPGGGTVGFPWLRDAADARPWCESLGEAGVVFAPGDCFDRPAHFRVGFGGAPERFEAGLARVEGRL